MQKIWLYKPRDKQYCVSIYYNPYKEELYRKIIAVCASANRRTEAHAFRQGENRLDGWLLFEVWGGEAAALDFAIDVGTQLCAEVELEQPGIKKIDAGRINNY